MLNINKIYKGSIIRKIIYLYLIIKIKVINKINIFIR